MKSEIETRFAYQRWPVVLEITTAGVYVKQKGRKHQKAAGQLVTWEQVVRRVFPGAVEVRKMKLLTKELEVIE